MKRYVLICCQKWDHTNDVLLVRKDKPEWQKGLLNLPGGKIEEGETDIEAAERELKEETGYVSAVPVRMMGAINDGSNEILCYKAIVPPWLDPKPCEKETQEVFWESWDKARAEPSLIPNLKIIIPLIRCGVQGWIIRDQFRSANSKTMHGLYMEVPCEDRKSD